MIVRRAYPASLPRLPASPVRFLGIVEALPSLAALINVPLPSFALGRLIFVLPRFARPFCRGVFPAGHVAVCVRWRLALRGVALPRLPDVGGGRGSGELARAAIDYDIASTTICSYIILTETI